MFSRQYSKNSMWNSRMWLRMLIHGRNVMLYSKMEVSIQLITPRRNGKMIQILNQLQLFHHGLKINSSMHSGKVIMLESFILQTGRYGRWWRKWSHMTLHSLCISIFWLQLQPIQDIWENKFLWSWINLKWFLQFSQTSTLVQLFLVLVSMTFMCYFKIISTHLRMTTRFNGAAQLD